MTILNLLLHLNKLLGKIGPGIAIFWLSRKKPKIFYQGLIQSIQHDHPQSAAAP